jgi:hypothetical protein
MSRAYLAFGAFSSLKEFSVFPDIFSGHHLTSQIGFVIFMAVIFIKNFINSNLF